MKRRPEDSELLGRCLKVTAIVRGTGGHIGHICLTGPEGEQYFITSFTYCIEPGPYRDAVDVLEEVKENGDKQDTPED